MGYTTRSARRPRRRENSWTYIIIYLFVWLCIVYCTVATLIFEYKNPLSNKMAFFGDFLDVMSYEKLAKYQPESYILKRSE